MTAYLMHISFTMMNYLRVKHFLLIPFTFTVEMV